MNLANYITLEGYAFACILAIAIAVHLWYAFTERS